MLLTAIDLNDLEKFKKLFNKYESPISPYQILNILEVLDESNDHDDIYKYFMSEIDDFLGQTTDNFFQGIDNLHPLSQATESLTIPNLPIVQNILADGNCLYASIGIHLNIDHTLIRQQVYQEISRNIDKYEEALSIQILDLIHQLDRINIVDSEGLDENFILRMMELSSIHNETELLNTIREELVPIYVNNIAMNGFWAGNVEIAALSNIRDLRIEIFTPNGNTIVNYGDDLDKPLVQLTFDGEHYNLIIDYISNELVEFNHINDSVTHISTMNSTETTEYPQGEYSGFLTIPTSGENFLSEVGHPY